MSGEGRSFRRKTAKFWKLWPLPPIIDEVHRVIYIDGIYLGRKAVILIARSEKYVLGWYLGRTENSAAYAALLSRIAPPDMVLTDGGNGFEKARRKVWRKTKVQRCLFHVFSQVKRYTTSKPKLEAGLKLYKLALELLRIKTLKQASDWVESYLRWCYDWEDFLGQKTFTDNTWVWTHERLVKARNSLNTLVNKGTMFTFLDLELSKDGPLPATNNKIEGGVNAPLRQLLREHRGMNIDRRIKAVFWWCYLHTECPLGPKKMLEAMPTDDYINSLYLKHTKEREQEGPEKWGTGIMWSEFHHLGPYQMNYD